LPAVVVVEQLGWLLAWDGGHDELSGEAALVGPFEEVAGQLSALGVRFAEPAVEVVLPQVVQRDLMVVEPLEDIEGDKDAATQVAAC
jgi:hypothetical protein